MKQAMSVLDHEITIRESYKGRGDFAAGLYDGLVIARLILDELHSDGKDTATRIHQLECCSRHLLYIAEKIVEKPTDISSSNLQELYYAIFQAKYALEEMA